MRRQLVLTNEAARHPFRQIMPRPLADLSHRPPLSDAAFFLISFMSGFIIFFGLIA